MMYSNNMPEKITEDELYAKILAKKPALSSFPRAEVMAKVYAKKPALRDAVISIPPSNLDMGQATGIREQTLGEKIGGMLPQTGVFSLGPQVEQISGDIKSVLKKPSITMPLAAGLASTGLGVIPAAGLVGLSAAGGKGFEIVGEGLATGRPKDELESAKEMAINGAIAGGLDAVTGGIAKAMPIGTLKNGFAKMVDYVSKGARPFKAVARAIGRGEQVNINAGKNAIERSLSKNIENLQKVLDIQRTSLGKQLEAESAKLVNSTKNTKPINIGQTLNDIEQDLITIQKTPGAGPMVAKGTEAARLRAMINDFKDGRMTVADAVRNKRYLDSVLDYPMGVAKPTEMGLLEPSFIKIRKAIKDELVNTAESVGQKSYVNATKKYGDYMEWYKTDGQSIYSTMGGEKSMADRIKKMGSMFKDIGIKGGVIENSKNYLPKATHKSIDKLQDDLAAGFFANLMESTPSGLTKDIVKLLLSPGSRLGTTAISKTIPVARAIQPIVRPLPGPGGILGYEAKK